MTPNLKQTAANLAASPNFRWRRFMAGRIYADDGRILKWRRWGIRHGDDKDKAKQAKRDDECARSGKWIPALDDEVTALQLLPMARDAWQGEDVWVCPFDDPDDGIGPWSAYCPIGSFHDATEVEALAAAIIAAPEREGE